MGQEPSCDEMFERISEYVDGELSPEAAALFEAHCEDCGPCKNFIATFKRTIQLAQEVGGSPCPSDLFSRDEIEEFKRLFLTECKP